jgi:hypothetical protein
VAGKDEAIAGQAEDLFLDRPVQRAGMALLEIAAAGAPDQQAVAGEGQALVVVDVGEAAVGVPRRGPYLEVMTPERDAIAMVEAQVGSLQCLAVAAGDADAAARGLLQPPGAGVTWSAWQCVSSAASSVSPSSSISARSRRCCSNTGSMITAWRVDAQPSR